MSNRIIINMNTSPRDIQNLDSTIKELTRSVRRLSGSFSDAERDLFSLDKLSEVSTSTVRLQNDALSSLRGSLFLLGNEFTRLEKGVATFTNSQAISIGMTKGLTGALALKGLAAKTTAGSVAILTFALKALPFVGLAIALTTFVGSLFSMGDATEDATLKSLSFTDALKKLRTRNEELIEVEARHQESVENLNQRFEDGEISMDAHRKGMRALEVQHQTFREEQELVSSQLEYFDQQLQTHGLTYDMLNDIQRNFINQAVSQWQSYFDKSTEMFRKVGQSNTQTLEEIIEYQNANYKATGQWQDDIISQP